MKGECTAAERGQRALEAAGYKKRKRGGGIHGEGVKHRPDKRARGGGLGELEEKKHDLPNDAQGNVNEASARARGGHVPKGKGKTIINIDASHKGDPEKEQMAKQEGMKAGAQMVAQKMQGAGGAPGGGAPPMPPHPPMMPPPGGMPPGAMPGMPPGGAPPMPPPRPPMPPPGAGGPPGMIPHPPMRDGGRMRNPSNGRFLGGGV